MLVWSVFATPIISQNRFFGIFIFLTIQFTNIAKYIYKGGSMEILKPTLSLKENIELQKKWS